MHIGQQYINTDAQFITDPEYCKRVMENSYTYVAGYGFAPPPKHTIERRLLRSYSSAIGCALLAFLAFSGIIYSFIITVLFYLSAFMPALRLSSSLMAANSQLAEGLSYSISLVFPICCYCYYIHMPTKLSFPMRRPNGGIVLYAIPITLLAVAVGSACSSAIGVLFSTFGLMPTSPDFSMPTTSVAFVFYFINMAVLPAIFEELVFRGAIMQSLRRFGDTFALVTSSILFSLIHGNLVQAPTALISGLAIGYFVLRTGSLRTGMLLHFINNFFALLMSVATVSIPYKAQVMSVYLMYIVYITVGLFALIAYAHTYGKFSLHPSKTALTEKHKFTTFFTSGGMVVFIIIIAVLSTHYFIPIF